MTGLAGLGPGNFGGSIAGPGDVNGDGYDDLLVGASYAIGAEAGAAYVYFGGPLAGATPNWILTGAADGDAFGTSVAGAGDVNGDGYLDVIIGAPGNDAAGTDAGRAYVYFGGPSADVTPDLILTGDSAGDNFGAVVAGAGDMNGDGYADVVVGAAYNDAGGFDAGLASVYFGGTTTDTIADVTISGGDANGLFGTSVAGAGDVNGDGFDDLIVGSWGSAYVFFGGTSVDAGIDLLLSGYGGSVAGVHDVNADGFDDLLVTTYVFFGGTVPNATPDLALTGPLGSSAAAGLGDINGDGFADIVVASEFYDNGRGLSGGASIFFGGETPNAVADITIVGKESFAYQGIAVAGAGDLNGDGLPDLAVGFPGTHYGGAGDEGVVNVYSNANSGSGTPEWRSLGDAEYLFGYSVASAGDFNGDGYDDVIVGSPYLSGRADVFYGGPNADAVSDLHLFVSDYRDWFGASVASAGDVNGDGFDDVIVGQPFLNEESFARAYIFFGGIAPDATADLVITEQSGGWEVPRVSVASAGDVNGDGFSDVILGVTGGAYIYLGGFSPDSISDIALTGDATWSFGQSVASAGDINGDGYSDFVVGSSAAAYVYHGGFSPNGTPDITLPGAAATVSGAGDVNADGYGDLIVGGSSAADVYFGGPSADVVSDLTLTSPAHGAGFDLAVAGLGDVDADGYGDFLVGGSVFYGGSSPNTIADVAITGNQPVAAAGDFNGDGRSDVIAGDPTFQPWGSYIERGAAYIYRFTGPAASPSVYRLADIPGDQGGVLDLRWTRSSGEATGDVTSYRIERSHPAGTTGYAWGTVHIEPAIGNPRYNFAAATFSDQTGTNTGVTCFRVTAEGVSGDKWQSIVKCGASIDNLAPGAPPALLAGESPDGDVLVSVSALASPPSDLAGYRVTRSADSTCDASDVEVGIALDTGTASALLEDNDTLFGTDAWYCATAIDVHGNESAYVGAVSANPAVLAAVKVVLQGAYQSGLPGGSLMRTDIEDALPFSQPYSVAPWSYAGSEAIDPADVAPANGRPDVLDNNAVVDWVLVEIRSSPSATDGKRAAALLLADGSLLDPGTGNPYASVRSAAPGSYHVAVFHRNHVAAMSRFLVALDGSAPSAEYDLSASNLFVYGANAVANLGGLYGLFAGDGDGNGNVLADDRQAIWLPTVGQTGYLGGDFNLDANVLADDRQSLWAPNVGRQSAVPGASLRPIVPTAVNE